MTLCKNVCPECGGRITVWFDVNTEVQYTVRPGGGLSKPTVFTSDTGEGRFGIRCNCCSWSVHGDDDEIDKYEDIISLGGEKTEGIEFAIKRAVVA